MPDSFYHATARFEAAFGDEQHEIVNALTQAIVSEFRDKTEVPFDERDELAGSFFRPKELEIHAVSLDEDGLSFRLKVPIRTHGRSYAWYRYLDPKLTIPLGEQYSWPVGPNEAVVFKPVTAIYGGPTPSGAEGFEPGFFEKLYPLSALFPPKYPPSGVLAIRLNRDLSRRLDGFSLALDGLPRNVKGRFIRMLYLSAVTITTVGYGDIVPITSCARLLVAIEATLGIIILGVFVSVAIAGRNGQTGDDEGESNAGRATPTLGTSETPGTN